MKGNEGRLANSTSAVSALAHIALPFEADDKRAMCGSAPTDRRWQCILLNSRYHDVKLSVKRLRVASPKPIQIILARQLASSLDMPILLVDTAATLIYYNEPAEAILGLHFDETGEMPAEDWSRQFALEDDARNPIPLENRPVMLAISEGRPISRAVWMRCAQREWRYLNITVYPLIGEGGQFLGAQMIFWEI